MNSQDRQFLAETGQRLRRARNARGLNLHELARLSGISAPALSNIETGKRDTRLTTLLRIADALRIPVSGLLEEPVHPEKTGSTVPGYDLDDYQ